MEAVSSLLLWGMDIIRFIQTAASPPLTVFMKAISALGSAATLIVFLPLIYWCVDEKKCLRIGTVVLFSVWLNVVLKYVFDQPRPFFAGYDPSVGMAEATTGGFPSGHAQSSLVFLIITASWLKKKLFYGVAAFLCLLVGFSRIYLGVHFPTDVLGGWLIGGLIVCTYFLFANRIETLITAGNTRAGGTRAGLIAAVSLSFIMILYRPAAGVLIPAGMILGLAAGYCLNKLYIGFTVSIPCERTEYARYLILAVRRFVLGAVGLFLLIYATGKLDNIFNNSENYNLFVFLRFALIALWISAGAPWLFRFIRLEKVDGR
jgi:membrane-associated phospholipid phosphatase